jgi:heat shock protein HslJ
LYLQLQSFFMKTPALIIFPVALLIASCSSAKKATQQPAAISKTSTSLNGTWELDLIPYPDGSFDQLYPNRKPTITFNEENSNFMIFTGCNTGKGKLVKNGGKIDFSGNMTMTMMACEGNGEKTFMSNLQKINQFSIDADGKSLVFIQGDIALMHFHRITK